MEEDSTDRKILSGRISKILSTKYLYKPSTIDMRSFKKKKDKEDLFAEELFALKVGSRDIAERVFDQALAVFGAVIKKMHAYKR